MRKLSIHLDEETLRRLEAAARDAEVSRSAWAREAIQNSLPQRKFPQWWFDLLGTWEDDRSAEEIIADMKSYIPQRERAAFDESIG